MRKASRLNAKIRFSNSLTAPYKALWNIAVCSKLHSASGKIFSISGCVPRCESQDDNIPLPAILISTA